MTRKSPPWVSPPIANSIEARVPERSLAPDLRRSIIAAKPELTIPPRDIRPAILRETSGGSSYVAKAVHFGASTVVGQSPWKSTAIGDNAKLTYSAWVNCADTSSNPELWGTDSHDSTSIGIGFNIPNDITCDWESSDGSFFDYGADAGTFNPAGWHHIATSANCNFPAGQKIGQLYYDGLSVTDPANIIDDAAAFLINFSGKNIGIPTNADAAASFSFSSPMLLADVQVWVGQQIDLSANIGKFISGGKPVNPAVAAAAFGQQTILLSGDDTHFPVNSAGAGSPTFVSYFAPRGNGNNGPGSISIPGAIHGATVVIVYSGNAQTDIDVSADFESTISVADQIQQTGVTDYSTTRLTYLISPGALTNASTSPSD